ncbi:MULTISPECIES: hypothetical protein [Streptomyces]|uniref:Lipoprotein n=1 Tax=Streptomyces caniscabiei TaxID=2746961 RepID=A0ABU4MH76_9ACTN|nr:MULTISPECIES: hypothetical protein [Streptomyces]MBE4734915.1 hypothetical protein [Streptomyces caniscabiei]MBE4754049.1 hypothetical protein [Streptomyces caniscabiei]MBE4767642.1 hypothetical protein [Streptomyces caniscabiei]MBE4784100.1 hypothetical protein [Streptomyces caniscabiei]MBE4791401.1 hypothetical protein [Streptomyces caniscabiei]
MIPESTSPARSLRIGVAVAAALLVTACSTLGQSPQGAALEGGIQESGTVGSENVQVGDIWWFALPVPTNKSAEPIEITGVSLVEVPTGMKVLGYGAYSLEDTEGLALLAKEGEELAPRFAALRDHSDKPVKVAPHASSDIYYLARLKITSLPSRSARYCEFDYRQSGRAYTQTLDCEVELTGK